MKLNSTLSLILLLMLTSLVANLATAQTCTLTLSATAAESQCKATGTITAIVTNGSGQYNYMVTGGSYSTTTSSNIIQGLAPGTYSVKVKDIVSGCTAEQDNVVVGGNYQDPRFQLSVTDVTCQSGSNGSISVINLQYGRAPFVYKIVAPSPYGVGTSNSTGVFTGLPAGDYSIQLADSCGGQQTRIITIANYSWNITSIPTSKVGCDTVAIAVALADNHGNNNSASTVFNGFIYGASIAPGDTVWSPVSSFHFYKGTARAATIIVKDACGNQKTTAYFDAQVPNVNASVSKTNYQCSTFDAKVTGQQNLNSPQYCLYDNSNTLLSCNATGVFTALPYGSYCIVIKDNCYDTSFSRCFSATQPVPNVNNTVSISNYTCNDFTATITGQQNLYSPQYCLYDSSGTLVVCNLTGVFNNLPYGQYCISVTDACTGTVLNRCFTRHKPIPNIAAVQITNTSCNTFTATTTGQSNLTNGQYCIYDVNGNLIACNLTGVFPGLAYGTYCIHVKNDPTCYDTTIIRCFTVGMPVPTASNTVSLTNQTCTGFTASITGQQNLTNPQYCLYDNTNTLISCNLTGIFTNLPYGAYCISIHNDPTCLDTTFQRCFSATQPVPNVDAAVNISNKACATFSASITGQQNLTSPQFCLYDNSNTLVTCNSTGQFDNINYGSYCIKIVNTCYDTTFTRCFTENAQPVDFTISTTASCTIGTTDILVTVKTGLAPFTVNIYNPGGILVSTTNTSSNPILITGLTGLPPGAQYKVVVSANCGAADSTLLTPVASSLLRNINSNSKCPGGQWQNGSGDLTASAQFSGGTVFPEIVSKNGSAFPLWYSVQSGSNFTWYNLEPATYVIRYWLTGCSTIVYDTVTLNQYSFPSLDQSGVYQCNNNNFSVSAAVSGGVSPFTYEIIGSSPAAPSIIQGPQASPTFGISNGTTYSVVRLRAIDACGNATINDAGILPLGNTVVTSSSNCFYNDISLFVDTIANATYMWYRKTGPTDSVLMSTNQSYTIPYLLPADTGMYTSVVSVNSGCLTKVFRFRITGSCNGLLSASGINFEGSLEKENVQLKWQTIQGFEADKFIVERSTDGSHFAPIGSVNAAAGNSQFSSEYFFSDGSAAAGRNYYRLAIVKVGRANTYTQVVSVNKAASGVISVMPNPVADAFTVRFSQVQGGSYSISLISAEGKKVMSSRYSILPGDARTIQRPSGLATGVYYLNIQNTATNATEVIKLFFK